MKSTVFAILAVLVSTQSSMAAYIPGWERPILHAHMDLGEGRFGFENMYDVELTMTRQDGVRKPGPTGFILKAKVDHDVRDPSRTETIDQFFVVKRMEKDTCGSVMYFAEVKQNTPKQNAVGARFNMVVTDHTHRICEDFRRFTWEVSIRRGYGWCGTMDDVAELGGNPEGVFTIMNRY